MSSPSNIVIVIVISHVPDPKFVRSAAYETDHEWQRTHPPDVNDRYWYGEQVAHAFIAAMCVGEGYVDGAEGALITWGYNGNHVNIDDVFEAVEPFVHKLIDKFYYTKLTLFHQPDDQKMSVYCFDGTDKKPWPAILEQLAFDVDIGRIPRPR